MKEFKKLENLYSIGYYFKSASHGCPRTLNEAIDYLEQHGSLPFKPVDYDNWMYELIVEGQRKKGIYNDQFFTPPKVAKQFADLFENYVGVYKDESILDVAAGFGMLTKALNNVGYKNIVSFEADIDLMIPLLNNTNSTTYNGNFEEFEDDYRWDYIISNPPFNDNFMNKFWKKSYELLEDCGKMCLILPTYYFKTSKGKYLKKALEAGFAEPNHLDVCCEDFFHTKTRCSIFHVEKMD
jgi:predicted RNA methylase